MQSPRAEWTLGIAYLVILDVIRARGEADGDTASEVLRDMVARHPRGRVLLAAGVVCSAIAFHHHIDQPLRRPQGEHS